jgi:hypothetical protein
MSFVLNTLLDAPNVASPPSSTLSVPGFCRSSMLLSCSELVELVSLFTVIGRSFYLVVASTMV